jgi:hypothetical protein
MSIEDVSAEQLAKLFHHYREALTHGCNHNEEESSPWDRVSQQERKLMVAAARLALLDLSTPSVPVTTDREYFAKPGEADWGC